MKKSFAVLLGFFCLCSVTAWLNDGIQAQATKANGRVRIGFSMDTLKEERWLRDRNFVEQRARALGADVEVTVANGDDQLQTRQATDMLARGIDVLIVAPHNAATAASIVEAAHRKSVPVIAYDRLIRNAPVDLYVAHQVARIGEMQAQYALSHVPKGNYVLIGGSPTDNNAVMLRKGQMSILKPAIDTGAIKIINADFARDWSPEEATRITKNALASSGNKIQAIVASNDGTAGGAIAALEAAGLAGKVLVTGQDAERAAVQRIVRGTQAMTVYKSIQQLAFQAVDAAVRLARKQPPAATEFVDNGSKAIPAILLNPILVDKSNVDATVINDGYHTKAQIYGK